MDYTSQLVGRILDYAQRQDIEARATPAEWAADMKRRMRK